MPTDTPTPSAGKAALSLLIIIGSVAAPITASILVPGSWIVRVTTGVGVAAVYFLFGALALNTLMGTADRQAPGRMPAPVDNMSAHHPDPGPEDPVFYVAWDDRGRGCTDRAPHDEHLWYWRADMPYVRDGHALTAPVRGALPCYGVKP